MKLKKIRENLGLTPGQACKRLRIVRSTLNRYENLTRFPNNKILKKIKKIYKLTDEDLSELFLEYFYKGEI